MSNLEFHSAAPVNWFIVGSIVLDSTEGLIFCREMGGKGGVEVQKLVTIEE